MSKKVHSREKISDKCTSTKVGRDAKTGQFIPVKEAEKRPATTVVESIRTRKKQHTGNTGPRITK